MDTIHQQNFGDQCIVASFRPDWIAEAKAIALKLAQAARAHFVHPCWERFEHPSSLLTSDWMAYVRQADLGIICWHEERPDEIAALRRIGVDGICSDSPELLR